MNQTNENPGYKGALEHMGAVNIVLRKIMDIDKDTKLETKSIIGSQNALVSITGANLKYV